MVNELVLSGFLVLFIVLSLIKDRKHKKSMRLVFENLQASHKFGTNILKRAIERTNFDSEYFASERAKQILAEREEHQKWIDEQIKCWRGKCGMKQGKLF